MSDYLWDKTGEPDAEVERLEKLLGTLAHRPRALELPPAARVLREPPRRFTRPAVAAAAALALMLLAGAWLFAARRAAGERHAAALPAKLHNLPTMPHKPSNMQQSLNNKTTPPERPSHQQPARASRPARRPRAAASHANAELSKKKRGGVGAREEARKGDLTAAAAERQQAAKAQLVYALRLTGAKLSEVQTKVRGASDGRPADDGRNKIR